MAEAVKKTMKVIRGVSREENDKIISEFNKRINTCQEIYKEKFKRIRDARKAYKQYMPDKTRAKQHNATGIVGNDYDRTYESNKSHYLMPITTAVAEKMISEMQANPFRFEWETMEDGKDISEAFSTELLKIYSLKNNNIEKNIGLWHAIVSGTMITQTYTENEIIQKILPNGTTEPISQGRTIGIQAYDPLTVFLDWNAKPGRVSETSEWAVVTIGKFDSDYIEDMYGIRVSEGSGNSYASNDIYSEELELDAGTDKEERIPVREYYKRDGYRYTIINDSVVYSKDVNSNGIYGRIPLNVAPIFYDPDSPYGFTLHELLEPSIEMCSTAINQIADISALNAKMPVFYIDGVLTHAPLTINEYDYNQLVPLDASELMMGNTNRQIKVTDLIDKPQFPDITQGGLFLYERGLEAIWFVTGLNPTTLGGIQTKQIRNADVMATINQAALRSSSKPVINIEQGFMNPTTWDIARIFEMYYDDFPSFKKAGITKEFLKDLKNIRVVNGSFLPGDDMSEAQKMSLIFQLAQANPNAFDLDKVYRKLMQTNGFRNVNSVMRNPLELLDEQQALEVYTILQSQGGAERIKQIAEQKLMETGVLTQ